MKRLAFVLSLPFLVLAASPEDEVKSAEREWASAVVKKDTAALGRVLADDLAYTHSDGRLDTKAAYIESLTTGRQSYDAAEHQAIDVRSLGSDIAVVRAKLRMVATSGGKPATPGNFSVLRVYRKKGGQWQMVAHQSARLAQ
ncbi:MAG TPA: nuclear transport factor 2 family protein [Bryobacteraceae bacterium]|nr:nuclear transport factor 2 family protein [Bryobacteraceae bacterium]